MKELEEKFVQLEKENALLKQKKPVEKVRLLIIYHYMQNLLTMKFHHTFLIT